MKQRSFASLSFGSKKKLTRRERFLGEMDNVVLWAALLALIEPSYPTAGHRGQAQHDARRTATTYPAAPIHHAEFLGLILQLQKPGTQVYLFHGVVADSP